MATRKEKTKRAGAESPASAITDRPLPSAIGADASGGKLPPIPMSEALRNALFADARRCLRSPRDQVRAILKAYYECDEPSGQRAHVERIGRQLAAAIEHPDTPAALVDQLEDFWLKFRNEFGGHTTPQRTAKEIREQWLETVDAMAGEKQ
jgi:hypothetical protein